MEVKMMAANEAQRCGGVTGDRLPALSDRDREVLERIFNPCLPSVDLESLNGTQENDDYPPDGEDKGTATELMEQIRELESKGIQTVEEGGNMQRANELFTKAIELDENQASSYNNRAQARRLLSDIEGAKSDLEKAIGLSRGKGKVACQAYTQRALIYKLEGKDDLALEDFKKAAKLGSEFSRAQVVSMNPYAAMCNAMMSEMLAKVRRGEIDP